MRGVVSSFRGDTFQKDRLAGTPGHAAGGNPHDSFFVSVTVLGVYHNLEYDGLFTAIQGGSRTWLGRVKERCRDLK